MKKLLMLFFVIALENYAGASDMDSSESSVSVSKNLVQAFLDESKLNLYFHTGKLYDRIPLIVLKNDYFQNKLFLEKFERPVEHWGKVAVKEKDKPYLLTYEIFQADKKSAPKI